MCEVLEGQALDLVLTVKSYWKTLTSSVPDAIYQLFLDFVGIFLGETHPLLCQMNVKTMSMRTQLSVTEQLNNWLVLTFIVLQTSDATVTLITFPPSAAFRPMYLLSWSMTQWVLSLDPLSAIFCWVIKKPNEHQDRWKRFFVLFSRG